MAKFKKAYNLKIISLFVAIIFFINSTASGIELSNRSHLRNPLLTNSENGRERLIESYRLDSIRLLKKLGLSNYDLKYIRERLFEDSDLETIEVIISFLKTFYEVFEQEGIDYRYIEVILFTVALHVYNLNLKEIAERLDNAAPHIASLIRNFKQLGVHDLELGRFLQTIVIRNDIKELAEKLSSISFHIISLISTCEQLGTEIESYFMIEGYFKAFLFEAVDSQDAVKKLGSLEKAVKRLQEVASNLPRTKQQRERIEQEIKETRQKGRFSRSIVAIQGYGIVDEDGLDRIGGSAFVVDEIEDYYILLTNTHLVYFEQSVELSTRMPSQKPIGTAFRVLVNRDRNPDIGDVAILVIKKEEVQGGELVPIKIAPGFKQGQIATLVSGYNTNVSSGHLISVGDIAILLGAKTMPFDSGSPYLVKTETGYSALAVCAKMGAVGMLFTPNMLGDILRQIDMQKEYTRLRYEGKSIDTSSYPDFDFNIIDYGEYNGLVGQFLERLRREKEAYSILGSSI